MNAKATKNRLFVVIAVVAAALAMSLCLGFAQPQTASASVKSANAKAHKAYRAKMNKLVQKSNLAVSYCFVDITGDKIDECLVGGGNESVGEFIYTYKSGKAKKLLNFYRGGFSTYYSKSRVTKIVSYRMGVTQTVYFQWSKKKKQLVKAAGLVEDYNRASGVTGTPARVYYVNGKGTSKAKYKAKLRRLTKGKKKAIRMKTYKPAATVAKAKPFAKAYLKSTGRDYSNVDYVETGTDTVNGKLFIHFYGVRKYSFGPTVVWRVGVFKDGTTAEFAGVSEPAFASPRV